MPTGVIIDANPAFCQFFGARPALTGRNFAELVDADDRAAVAQPDRHGRRRAKPASAPSNCAPAPAASAWPNCSPARYPRRRAVLYLVDVSEQKALETKFAQSQKMQAVGQLAGGVAHDFNNLLTVIIGNCEFLLMRHQAGDPSFKEINEVHQNALRAATLVGQLLAFCASRPCSPRCWRWAM